MFDLDCPADAMCPDEPTCMWCGKECKTTEIVWTGDEESYEGFELWCYCDNCKIDTFHKLVQDPNSIFDKYGNLKNAKRTDRRDVPNNRFI